MASAIAAIATPPGRGGVAIVRISGPDAIAIARQITGKTLQPRLATYSNFYDHDASVLDQGIAIYFPAPRSFTGEDVIELQGHGGPVVMDMLLSRVISLGASIARPGEFSERAFLNDKIDLSQAEAIADLINSMSQQAAKGAVRSLQGAFSNEIKNLAKQMLAIRTYVEAAIDFPEEEADFLSNESLAKNITDLRQQFLIVLQQTKQGALLRDGITLVLSGRPNAGKSSLMNQLSDKESSIVTPVPGTTRDLINEHIHLDGIPLKLVDTAGIRLSHGAVDEVEAEGMRRALGVIRTADGVLVIIDLACDDWQDEASTLVANLKTTNKIIIVLNKMDLLDELPSIPTDYPYPVIAISAKHGQQIDALTQLIKHSLAIDISAEGAIIARARHLDGLNRAFGHVLAAIEQLHINQAAELMAEELRLGHDCLNEITGEFTSDDLLGEIFSTFCIGK